MVGLQSLDLPIGVRIPVSQPILFSAAFNFSENSFKKFNLKFIFVIRISLNVE